MFSFYTLGVMCGTTEEVASGAEVCNTPSHFHGSGWGLMGPF